MAAKIRPSSGSMGAWFEEDICWISQVFVEEASQAMQRIRPMSPIRLYNTAWRAAVLASARQCNQPMRRNDMIPTPSHPMNRRNMLLATVSVSIAMRKINKYKKNFFV